MGDWHHIPDLDAGGLRRFGLLFGAIFGALFGGLFPWLADRGFVVWPWAVTGVLWLWALFLPATLRPFYRVWMRVGLTVGWVNTRIILALVFYLVLFPVGRVMKLVGGDPMHRRFLDGQPSYRQPSESAPVNRMRRPY